MWTSLSELRARYRSVREVIQKDSASPSQYNFSVSFDFALKRLISNYNAFSVGVCSKTERAQQNQELKGHVDSLENQFKQTH